MEAQEGDSFASPFRICKPMNASVACTPPPPALARSDNEQHDTTSLNIAPTLSATHNRRMSRPILSARSAPMHKAIDSSTLAAVETHLRSTGHGGTVRMPHSPCASGMLNVRHTYDFRLHYAHMPLSNARGCPQLYLMVARLGCISKLMACAQQAAHPLAGIYKYVYAPVRRNNLPFPGTIPFRLRALCDSLMLL